MAGGDVPARALERLHTLAAVRGFVLVLSVDLNVTMSFFRPSPVWIIYPSA